MLKRQKGITLIALVITIIVMLILAGVSIAMVTGENGILTRSQSAVEKNRAAAIQEEIELAITENQMRKYDEGTALTKDQIISNLATSGKLTDEEVATLATSDTITIGGVEIDFSTIDSSATENGGNQVTEDFGESNDSGIFIITNNANVTIKNATLRNQGSAVSAIPNGVIRGINKKFASPFDVSYDVVCALNGNTYGTIQAAVDAASNGDTITVLKDLDIGSVEIELNKDLVIDFQNHSISASSGTLAIKNGSGIFNMENVAIIECNINILRGTFKDCTFSNNTINIRGGNFENCTFDNTISSITAGIFTNCTGVEPSEGFTGSIN